MAATDGEATPAALVRQHSASLLRQTSITFTGGASAFNHGHVEDDRPNEATPLRRQSTRVATGGHDAVQAQLQRELQTTLQNSIKWIVLVGLLFLALMITMLLLFIFALLAVVNYHDKPCDQPLKWYLLAGVVCSQVTPTLANVVIGCFEQPGMGTQTIIRMIAGLPGWVLIGWGFYMISESKTCQKTNPDLFYPTRNYIYGQLVLAFFFLAITIAAGIGARWFMLHGMDMLNNLNPQPGCQAAVKKLPKIDDGSEELVDEEDGKVRDCPICLEALSKEHGIAVKTPCSHYFHEECLATWCKNRLVCPLCRQQVGEADKADGDSPV